MEKGKNYVKKENYGELYPMNVPDLLEKGNQRKSENIHFKTFVIENMDLIEFPGNKITLSYCNLKQTVGEICCFQENLIVEKRIDKIDDEKFYPDKLATNDEKSYLFVSNRKKKFYVLILDKSFNKISIIENKARNLAGLCFKKHKLYASDKKNDEILIYSTKENSFSFQNASSIILDRQFRPIDLTANDSLLCVKLSIKEKIENVSPHLYFYSLKSNEFVYKLCCTTSDESLSSFRIFVFGSEFYELNGRQKMLTCYKQENDKIIKTEFSFKKEEIDPKCGYFVHFKGGLVMLAENNHEYTLLQISQINN